MTTRRFQNALSVSTGLVFLSAVLLGGNAGHGYIGDAVLQMCALPLLLFVLVQTPRDEPRLGQLAACMAVVAVPAIQLLPLPPFIWTRLPNRTPFVDALASVGTELPWLPISVTPNETWLACLSLIVPCAIFLATAQLNYQNRRVLVVGFVAVGVVAAFCGLIQVAQGPSSPLRFYSETNDTEPVGFFANRNHFAAMLYVAMVFALALSVEAVLTLAASRKAAPGYAWLIAVAAFSTVFVLLATQAMTRSRAGIGLTVLALAGAILLAVRDPRARTVRIRTVPLMVLIVSLTVVIVGQVALLRLMERFAADGINDSTRAGFNRTTWQAAVSYFPFGSGVGSFVPVYAQFEKTEDLLDGKYVNQAHNDVIQAMLEGGAVAAVTTAALLFLIIVRSYQVWRAEPPGSLEIDRLLARAACIVLALLALHAFVDYGLRTGALMATCAFAVGLLCPAPATANVLPKDIIDAVPTTKGHKSRRSRAQRQVPKSAQWSGAIAGPKEGQSSQLQWPSDPTAPKPRSGVEQRAWPKEWEKGKADTTTQANGDAPPAQPAADNPNEWPSTPVKPKDSE